MTKNSDKDYAAILQRLLFLKRELARMKRDFLRSVDVDALRKKVGLRANRALDKLGVVDGVSLARVTVWKLVCVKNCGRGTVDEIETALKEMGAELPQGEEE
jgi:DNA-directed RNA polymerase alpha subunit